MPVGPVTLSQFILAEERRHSGASGEFTGLITDIAIACKIINREVARAGLTELLGDSGTRNVHGEKVQKLDSFAHDVIHCALAHTGQLAVCASEESEDIIPASGAHEPGKYVVNFDPLDGSSNINVNVTVGTIFSILPESLATGPARSTTAFNRAIVRSPPATSCTAQAPCSSTPPAKACTGSPSSRASASSCSLIPASGRLNVAESTA